MLAGFVLSFSKIFWDCALVALMVGEQKATKYRRKVQRRGELRGSQKSGANSSTGDAEDERGESSGRRARDRRLA